MSTAFRLLPRGFRHSSSILRVVRLGVWLAWVDAGSMRTGVSSETCDRNKDVGIGPPGLLLCLGPWEQGVKCSVPLPSIQTQFRPPS